jgi:predicted ATPase
MSSSAQISQRLTAPMLLALRLKNFKRYRDQAIDLSTPLILLVGPNSSGKSTVLKSLLAFKQTYEDQGDHAGFLSKGEYVDLGPFVEYVHNHNIRTNCSFEFLLRVTRTPLYRGFPRVAVLRITHELDPQTGHGRLADYTISLMPEADHAAFWTQNRPSDQFIRYERMQKSEEAYRVQISPALYHFFVDHLSTQRIPPPQRRHLLPSFQAVSSYLRRGNAQATRTTERGMTTRPVHSYDIPILNFVSNLEARFVNPFHLTFLTDVTEHLFALAALREIPQRSGPRTDERYRVGSRGQNTASVFLNFRQRAIKAGMRQSKIKEDFNRLEEWVQTLKLGQSVDLSSWRDLVDLRTSVGPGKTASHSIVDVGVGVSQALPILVQLAVMPEGSNLILEQPELHLYPWAQAEIGRILCGEAKRGKKFLMIETHSEHIVRGVQRHISNARPHGGEEYLTHDQIAVLYVHEDGRMERLHLDENGEFTEPWPRGFFDQGLEAFAEIIDNKKLPTKVR